MSDNPTNQESGLASTPLRLDLGNARPSGCIFRAMVPHPIRPTDPRTWPWIFYLWLAFALVGFAKPVWRWFQRKRAETWPATQGRVESTEINATKGFRTSTSSNTSTASFEYIYEVAGAKHSGTYKRQFGTDEESDDFLRNLVGRDVRVQFNPEHPTDSFVLDSAIDSLLSSRPPSAASPLEIRRYWNPLPVWLVRVSPLFEALAIIGFVVSALVNVGTLSSRWSPPNYFWVLHVGIFLVFFPAVFVAQKRVGSTNRKDFWKVVLKDAPDWMKYFLYAVFAYVAAIGIPPWIRALQQTPGTPRTGSGDWTLFSATWMVFYWASFAILYAAMKQERLRPRCVKGHPVPPGSNFCSQCGQPMVRT